jgi:hypothetical protein
MATSSSFLSATTARSCTSVISLQQGLGVGHPARQLGEVQLEGAADGVDTRQRHVALGQHALDARFGHAQGRARSA